MTGLGILCSGQGNQHPAMFDVLLGNVRAGSILDQAGFTLGNHPADMARQPDALFHNTVAQPLISTLQIATWAVLRNQLPKPKVFAGYSLGELIAYGCAGALSFPDTLALVVQRAALMDAAFSGAAGLLALRGLRRDRIEELCAETHTEIAIINGQDHFVLGGRADALLLLEHLAPGAGAHTVRRLQVTVPSHTSLLAECTPQFYSFLEDSAIGNPIVPVLAGINGAVVRNRKEALPNLAQQISQPINWFRCMETALEMGCRVFLELGPGNALSKMVQETYPEVKARSVDEFRSLQGVVNWVMKHCS